MNYKYDFSFFINCLKSMDLSLSDDQIIQFEKYYDLLIEWNNKMNLTAITDFDDVILKHFLDSISIVKYVDFSRIKKCIDIGTGAGFPGIPLAIVFPEIQFTLLDSLNKRVKFLKEVSELLGLNNIEEIHGRAEDYASNMNYREMYDLCVSRAVSKLSVLSEYCMPYIKVGGKFVSYKADHIEDELMDAKNAIYQLGGKLQKTYSFELFDSGNHRTFVVIDKKRQTPKKYPRAAGIPNKKPL